MSFYSYSQDKPKLLEQSLRHQWHFIDNCNYFKITKGKRKHVSHNRVQCAAFTLTLPLKLIYPGRGAIQSLLKVLGEANCSSDHLLPHLPFCICISLEFAFEYSHVFYFYESFHLYLYFYVYFYMHLIVFAPLVYLKSSAWI